MATPPTADEGGSEGDTRGRLTSAARELFHEHGYARTTIADIADRARIPPGNVYYHFRTKEALLEAVVAGRRLDLEVMLARCDRARSPSGSLKALVSEFLRGADAIAQFGCPHGSLCYELDAMDRATQLQAAGLLRRYVEWSQGHFRSLGCGRESHGLALELMSELEGASLLANTFQSPEPLVHIARRLERRIDALSSRTVPN